jgi:hypothetical protein
LGGWGSFGAAQRGALNRCATNAVEEDWIKTVPITKGGANA